MEKALYWSSWIPRVGTNTVSLNDSLNTEIVSERWLSPTTIATIRQCPLKLFFSRNKVPIRQTANQVIGIAVHQVCEEVPDIVTNFTDPVERRREVFRLLNVYLDCRRPNNSDWPYSVIAIRPEDLSPHIEFIFARLDQCANIGSQVSSAVRSLYVEHKVTDPLLNMVGVIDYLDIKESSILIRDYKTGQVLVESIAESIIDQLLLYAHMVSLEYPKLNIQLEVVFTRTGEIRSVELDQPRQKALVDEAHNLNEFYRSKRWVDLKVVGSREQCSDCGYRHACPKFWDLVDREFIVSFQELPSEEWLGSVYTDEQDNKACCEVILDSLPSIGTRRSSFAGNLRNECGPRVLVYFNNADHPHVTTFRMGDRVRILDGTIHASEPSKIELRKRSQIWDCASIKSLF
jgi:hypothetical protein